MQNISTGISLQPSIPKKKHKKILLAHGGGGRLSNDLIQQLFFDRFQSTLLSTAHDGAMFSVPKSRLAFTTDSYVVHPIFFPGGNIGDLAVNGTVNDLAMCGAEPLYLSAGFILEEGFPIDDLERIVETMKRATETAGIELVTGDTKVVERGKGDGIFINTSGIGQIPDQVDISPQHASEGDCILLNGNIADHGIAIMSEREGLEFETSIQTDSAALNGLVGTMLQASKNIHVLRDPTRGGLASSLNEIAMASKIGIRIEEDKIPLAEEVKGACEILGLDPLYIANEGKLLAFVPEKDAKAVLQAMQNHPLGKNAVIIGRVVKEHPGHVSMKTFIGSMRIIDMLTGEQLPRIC